MKILFVTNGHGVDYQADVVFHGLVSTGHDVTDSRYIRHQSGPLDFDYKVNLYGKGISIAGNLPDRSGISRDHDDIRQRIGDRYYDCVIYGSIERCLDFLDDVRKSYSRNRVVFIDGRDETDIREDLIQHGIYFKRELLPVDTGRVEPISFAVPASKYDYQDELKRYDLAQCIPGRLNTYNTYREETYYHQYAISRFALTYKKTGWDCLRHYEIVAAGAVPLFTDVDHCPITTMTTWPRRIQGFANDMAYRWLNGSWRNDHDYFELRDEFREYGRNHMTTESTAKHVVGKLC